MEIKITVRNKIAYSPVETIICGNSGYQIRFDFDDEWNAYETKTARFVYGNKYADVIFTGDLCDVPVLTDTTGCAIGVFAGNLQTTTPALVTCQKSILCSGGVPAEPQPDVYAQLLQMYEEIKDKCGIELQAAAVGQTIIVKAIDENGKPTEWEAVGLPEMPSDYVPLDGSKEMTGWLRTPRIEIMGNSKDNLYPRTKLFYDGVEIGSIDVHPDTHRLRLIQNTMDTGKAEVFMLPVPATGSNSVKTYDVLTTKQAVTIAQGGTGATTAADARTKLGASALNHAHNASAIKSGTLSIDRLPTIPISKGGTGATTMEQARKNLGIASPDWEAAEGEAGYVNNRTHWCDYSEPIVLLDNITYTNEEQMANKIFDIELVAGQTYFVIWDGVEYERTATTVTFDGTTMVSVGNQKVYGVDYEDTGEPFSFVGAPSQFSGTIICAWADNFVSATISLSTRNETVHPIPEKYLTDMRPYYVKIRRTDDGYACDETIENMTKVIAENRFVGGMLVGDGWAAFLLPYQIFTNTGKIWFVDITSQIGLYISPNEETGGYNVGELSNS